jgi:hypothetical protein
MKANPLKRSNEMKITKAMTEKYNWMIKMLDNSRVAKNRFYLQFNLKGTKKNIFCQKDTGAQIRMYGHEETFWKLVRSGLISYVPGDIVNCTRSYFKVPNSMN